MTDGPVLVVGSGLIGTSLALALWGDRDVVLDDAIPTTLSAALGRGAGRPPVPGERVSLVVVCTPLPMLAATLAALSAQHPGAVLTHVGSVQGPVRDDAVARGADPARLCGGHPMAGRETSGPASAESALFAGRPWLVCPGPETDPSATAAVHALARAAGAVPATTTPERHDAVVARVSHLPQVVSSALAARLLDAPDDARAAGPGLVDTTRLAASPLGLWHDVLGANAAQVTPLLRALAADLLAAADDLDRGGLDAVDDLLRRGAEGRALVPVKRARHDRDLVPVRVELPDRPGRLAAVLAAAGDAGVNIEDLRLDHLPGRPSGSLELLVARDGRDPLLRALRDGGVVVGGADAPDAPAAAPVAQAPGR